MVPEVPEEPPDNQPHKQNRCSPSLAKNSGTIGALLGEAEITRNRCPMGRILTGTDCDTGQEQEDVMEKRDRRIDIRVTEGERRSIAARARRSGETVSTYVRRTALRRKHDGAASAEIDGAELVRAHTDLKKLGGLLNQYMRAVNRHGLTSYDVAPIEAAAASVARAADGLSEAIRIIRD